MLLAMLGAVLGTSLSGQRSNKQILYKIPKDYPNSYAIGFRQSKTALFDQTFFRLDSFAPPSYCQSSRFHGFRALSGGGWCEGVLLYGSRTSLGCSALRAYSARNASFGRDQPSSKRVGGIGLAQKPPELRLRRGTQPSAAKATAGVCSRFVNDIDTARCCHRMIHAVGGRR